MKITDGKNGVTDLRRKFLSHVEKRAGRGSCWIWTGATSWGPSLPRRPYGIFWIGGRLVVARRLAYSLFGKGPPLGDRQVDCTCRESLCVNPAHLIRSLRRKRARRK